MIYWGVSTLGHRFTFMVHEDKPDNESTEGSLETIKSREFLKSRIETAMSLRNTEATVEAIRRELTDAIRAVRLRLDPRFYRAKAGSYARRLFLRDPDWGYTCVVMAWAPGQITPLHDHSGIWCVEGVLRGEMNVIQYELQEQSDELFRFVPQTPIRASVGLAGSLIPPIEYHVLENAGEGIAITLHIYGGEMDRCNVYAPRGDGWCERRAHTLSYDQ